MANKAFIEPYKLVTQLTLFFGINIYFDKESYPNFSTWRHQLCVWIVHLILAAFSIYYTYFFLVKTIYVSAYYASLIHQISVTVQCTFMLASFFANTICSIFNRRNHVDFVGSMISYGNFCQHNIQQNRKIDKRNFDLLTSFKQTLAILCLYFVANAAGTFIWTDNVTLDAILFGFALSYLFTSLAFVVGYFNLQFQIISQWMNESNLRFRRSLTTSNRKRLSKSLNSFEMLWQLRDTFQLAFGRQCLLNGVFDFMLVSTTIFSQVIALRRSDSALWLFLNVVHIGPHILKEILLARMSEKFAKQV